MKGQKTGAWERATGTPKREFRSRLNLTRLRSYLPRTSPSFHLSSPTAPMADSKQQPERRLQTQSADAVAQNTATGTSADNADRDQTGDDNRKQGRLKQQDDVQGGGGGNSGGGGDKKDD